MKTQPLKGMRDLLPREQALRDYIQGQILATYRAAGFQRISTPILEDMENLDKSDGSSRSSSAATSSSMRWQAATRSSCPTWACAMT